MDWENNGNGLLFISCLVKILTHIAYQLSLTCSNLMNMMLKKWMKRGRKRDLLMEDQLHWYQKRKVVKEIDCNVEEKDDGKFNVEDDDVLAYWRRFTRNLAETSKTKIIQVLL